MEIKYPEYYIYSYRYKKIEKTDPISIFNNGKKITFANCIKEVSISVLIDRENNSNNHAEIEVIKVNNKKINFNIPILENYFSQESEQQKYFIFQVALDVDNILKKLISGETYYSPKYL